MDEFECQYCHKQLKNRNSLKQHECRCAQNPHRINVIHEGFNSCGRSAWNKGLTAKTDARVANNGIKISAALKGKPGHPHTEVEKQHLSELAKQQQLGGFNMRKVGIMYNGIKLDSTYEVELAQDLDAHNIRWERCGRFPYTYDDVQHYYTPDFYLPDYDIYLDPKNDFLINNINPHLGYSDIDKINAVMSQNNIRILILDKHMLTWDSIQNLL